MTHVYRRALLAFVRDELERIKVIEKTYTASDFNRMYKDRGVILTPNLLENGISEMEELESLAEKIADLSDQILQLRERRLQELLQDIALGKAARDEDYKMDLGYALYRSRSM